MSPAHLDDHHHHPHHAPPFPPPLKTSRDSRSIKKPSPPSSSSSTTAAAAPLLASASPSASARPSQQQPQPRHPVIIYTHSPKIIHTQPRDFMALVQKLTGLSRSSPDDEPKPTPPLPPPAAAAANSGDGDDADAKSSKAAAGSGGAGVGEDNECSSVITDENCSSSVGDGGQVNSCFAAAPNFEAANGGSAYLSNHLPFLPNNAADFMCSNQPNFYDFNEATAFGFPGNSMRTTNYMPYSSFERTNNFREF
ncbi:hypothetical protein BT93_B0535 [Corymbia citriodora subsp. variegata]|nr:hypothetical protein BT93_B0535 [Corymbia citriodora subsp. variegata]